MAGSSSSFSATKFRTGIRFAMDMGTPPDAADQIVFYFNPTRATSATRDGEGIPFDPSAVITETPRPPARRPCAVEYLDASDEPTPFGSVLPAKVRVTLLDEDHQAVKGADYIVVSGDRYLRHHVPPAFGLFDAGIYQMVFLAENET